MHLLPTRRLFQLFSPAVINTAQFTLPDSSHVVSKRESLETMGQPSKFFELPRELRDQIYSYAFERTPQVLPDSPTGEPRPRVCTTRGAPLLFLEVDALASDSPSNLCLPAKRSSKKPRRILRPLSTSSSATLRSYMLSSAAGVVQRHSTDSI